MARCGKQKLKLQLNPCRQNTEYQLGSLSVLLFSQWQCKVVPTARGFEALTEQLLAARSGDAAGLLGQGLGLALGCSPRWPCCERKVLLARLVADWSGISWG